MIQNMSSDNNKIKLEINSRMTFGKPLDIWKLSIYHVLSTVFSVRDTVMNKSETPISK